MRALSLFAFVGLLCALMGLGLACKGASAPGVDPRAVARGTVVTMEQAWLIAAQLCVETAQSEEDPNFVRCASILKPARSALIAAADGVDAWTAADQATFPCLIKDGLKALLAVQDLLASQKVMVPALVVDAVALANQFAPQCVMPEGGAK